MMTLLPSWMMTTEAIKLLYISDIHFGLGRMDSREMADNFQQMVFPYVEQADAIFINGDFFDTVVSFDHYLFDPLYETILKLYQLCEHYQITLRFLQGTWEHDRNQLKRLNAFYKNNNFEFPFKVIEHIDAEELLFKNRSLRFIYAPDDLPVKSSDDIIAIMQEKLQSLGWSYVDYACLHGFFDFTFPEGISQENRIIYHEHQFPFVKKMIDVGHVHQHRVNGKVISNGSFDRLVFGDEDPKGFLFVEDYENFYKAHFIENTKAALFDTLLIGQERDSQIISDKIHRHLRSRQSERKISLRFVIEALEQREMIKAFMLEHYPQINCHFKKIDEKDKQHILLTASDLMIPTKTRIAPTLKTIGQFVKSYLNEDYHLSLEEIDHYLFKDSS